MCGDRGGVGFSISTSIVQKSVLIYHNRSAGESSGNERSTEKSVMWRDIGYNYEPIEDLFFLFVSWHVGNVHNLQIEIPRRLGCEKPCGGKSVVRARLHVYYMVRVTLDDPPLNCKNDSKVRIRIIGGLRI